MVSITVTGKRPESGTQGLVARNSRSATNTDTPINEIPRAVVVVTGEQLERQQVRDVAEALRNVSGFVSASASGQGQTNIASRGFATTQTVDGQRSNVGNVPIVGVESIEFLKGADQVLLGTGQPGGVANINLKKPQAAPVRQGVAEGGVLWALHDVARSGREGVGRRSMALSFRGLCGARQQESVRLQGQAVLLSRPDPGLRRRQHRSPRSVSMSSRRRASPTARSRS